jgi:hypothetical protein
MARRRICHVVLLLLAAPALWAQLHEHHTFQVAPLDECKKFAELPPAELFQLRDHSQLRQSKRRREMELRSFLEFKKKPKNETIPAAAAAAAAVQAAMWNSSR